MPGLYRVNVEKGECLLVLVHLVAGDFTRNNLGKNRVLHTQIVTPLILLMLAFWLATSNTRAMSFNRFVRREYAYESQALQIRLNEAHQLVHAPIKLPREAIDGSRSPKHPLSFIASSIGKDVLALLVVENQVDIYGDGPRRNYHIDSSAAGYLSVKYFDQPQCNSFMRVEELRNVVLCERARGGAQFILANLDVLDSDIGTSLETILKPLEPQLAQSA